MASRSPSASIGHAYQLNVTVGGDSTIVGGTLGNFTTTGNSSNFIIEDPTLLGLTAGSRSGERPHVNGDGNNDTFYFVGGSASSFGNVTLTEPAGSTGDTVDFSNFEGVGGINLNLTKTGMASR